MIQPFNLMGMADGRGQAVPFITRATLVNDQTTRFALPAAKTCRIALWWAVPLDDTATNVTLRLNGSAVSAALALGGLNSAPGDFKLGNLNASADPLIVTESDSLTAAGTATSGSSVVVYVLCVIERP